MTHVEAVCKVLGAGEDRADGAVGSCRNCLVLCHSYDFMPADPFGDALHLAIASYHRCDFLVTWNCRHLANANKFGHIRRVNGILGLFVPSLVTPLELVGEDPSP